MVTSSSLYTCLDISACKTMSTRHIIIVCWSDMCLPGKPIYIYIFFFWGVYLKIKVYVLWYI